MSPIKSVTNLWFDEIFVFGFCGAKIKIEVGRKRNVNFQFANQSLSKKSPAVDSFYETESEICAVLDWLGSFSFIQSNFGPD